MKPGPKSFRAPSPRRYFFADGSLGHLLHLFHTTAPSARLRVLLTEYFVHPLGRGRVGCAVPNLGAGVSQNYFEFLPTDQGISLGYVLYGVYPDHLVAAGSDRQLGKAEQYLRLNGCLWQKAPRPFLCGSAPNRPSAFGTIWPDAARLLRNGTSKISHQGSARHVALRLKHKDSCAQLHPYPARTLCM